MHQTDVYYRAFRTYRGAVDGQRDILRDRNALVAAGGQGEIAVTRSICTVDEAWINAIEAGLLHIEKAIREERQFIYSNGEVVPIEKVKQVSKDSVEHLARHAELISHVSEGERLIPDELYTVERLSDYAVYENRFLYMLLCYLRDFVTVRYRRIQELTECYRGRLSASGEAEISGRSLSVRMELSEERQDDPFLHERNPARGLIDRMDLILKTITAFLATPLMESAGKTAMLKPPITKTNVLKMDNNFKGAVALYEYIIAYEGDGYTVTEEVRSLDPFGEAAEDVAELQLLLAHVTRLYGLGLEEALKASWEHDEEMKRLADLTQQAELLETLRLRWLEDPEGQTEYVLELEKQARGLLRELERMEPLYREMDERRGIERELRESLRELQGRLDAYADVEEHTAQACEEAVQEAELGFQLRREELARKHAEEARVLREACEAEKDAIGRELLAQREQHAAELEALRSELADRQADIQRLQEALEEASEGKRVLEARLLGRRASAGEITGAELEAMTDREQFDELERELDAFVRLYKRVWSQAKRRIRRDLINLKNIKGQSGAEKHRSRTE